MLLTTLKHFSIKNILVAFILFLLPILANAQQTQLYENENILEVIKAKYPHAFDAYGKAFYQDMHYEGGNLEGTVNFSSYKFTGDVRFLRCTFKKTVDFSEATLGKVVDLTGSTFKAGIDFTSTRLPHKLILKNINLEGDNDTLDFTRIVPTYAGCAIDLQGTDISKVKLDYGLGFKLLFSDDDGKIEFTVQQKKKIYRDLLAQQKRLGFRWGYDKLLKEFVKFYPNETQLMSGEMPPKVLPENVTQVDLTEGDPQIDSLIEALEKEQQIIANQRRDTKGWKINYFPKFENWHTLFFYENSII